MDASCAEDAPVEYRDIPGEPGYRAGNDGSIWSCVVRGSNSRRLSDNWQQLRAGKTDHGYYTVAIRGRSRHVHRLVLLAFVGPKPKGLVTRHLDGNPGNNYLSNLEYGTCKQNQADRWLHGTQSTRKLKPEQVFAIREKSAAGSATADLAAEYGVCQTTIRQIVGNRTWRTLKCEVQP